MCYTISSKYTIQRNILDTATFYFLIGIIQNFDRKIKLQNYPQNIEGLDTTYI